MIGNSSAPGLFVFFNATGTDYEMPQLNPVQSRTAALPEKVDCGFKGVLSRASDKNQGRYGSCCAVSMAGAVEGAAVINPEKKGPLKKENKD